MMYTVYRNDPNVDHYVEIARLDSDYKGQDYRMTDLIDIAMGLPELRQRFHDDFPNSTRTRRRRGVGAKAHDPNEGIIQFPSMSYTILPDQYIPD